MSESVSPRVYLETTIPSYLTARPSRDLVRAAHQQVTRDWWAEERHAYVLFVSELVLEEAAAGDTEAAAVRLEALAGLQVLRLTDEATALGRELVRSGGIPAKASADALHIAMATVNGMDFLLTWNCAHMANARMRGRIEGICRSAGFEPPIICTPIDLVEE